MVQKQMTNRVPTWDEIRRATLIVHQSKIQYGPDVTFTPDGRPIFWQKNTGKVNMAQKQTDKQPNAEELMKASGLVSDSTESSHTAINLPLLTAGIDRVLEILHSLPTLKRYGDDAAAIQEAPISTRQRPIAP